MMGIFDRSVGVPETTSVDGAARGSRDGFSENVTDIATLRWGLVRRDGVALCTFRLRVRVLCSKESSTTSPSEKSSIATGLRCWYCFCCDRERMGDDFVVSARRNLVFFLQPFAQPRFKYLFQVAHISQPFEIKCIIVTLHRPLASSWAEACS